MNSRRLALAAVAIAIVAFPAAAFAAGAGGNMPWNNPLNLIMQNLTGSTAFVIGLLAMAGAGYQLAWGNEMSYTIRGLVIMVFVTALLVNLVAFATAIGLIGAVV